MFRENKDHLQANLSNSLQSMDPRLVNRLKNSWSGIFYEHVFCKIEERLFAPLYCADNGRPNSPVNILVALEIIKSLFEYTDDVLLDQYAFNYQISYALGQRTLGERYFAPRTLYEWRSRLYVYCLNHPEQADLIYEQFVKLTQHFLDLTQVNTTEGRVDSTGIVSNIKLGGRLSLAYDVLVCAVKALPETLVADGLKLFLKPEYKTEFLYKLKNTAILSRIQHLVNHCAEVLNLVDGHAELQALPAIQQAERFIREQATFQPESKQWQVKGNKEIEARSLQSAYDSDATYRNKNGKKQVGYVLNLTETCADENPVQLITHYQIAPNSTSDVDLLKEALPVLEEKGMENLYLDGGYYSSELKENAQSRGIHLHYTDMTGCKVTDGKLPYSAFTIEALEKIVKCPADQPAIRANYSEKSKSLSAHFAVEICQQCSLKDQCRVKFQKKSAVLHVSQKTLINEANRLEIINKETRRESTSKRAAIEGTNSVLKRAFGIGELKVRGLVKSTLVVGAKLIAYNFRQVVRFFQGDIRKKVKKLQETNQGIVLPIC